MVILEDIMMIMTVIIADIVIIDITVVPAVMILLEIVQEDVMTIEENREDVMMIEESQEDNCKVIICFMETPLYYAFMFIPYSPKPKSGYSFQ